MSGVKQACDGQKSNRTTKQRQAASHLNYIEQIWHNSAAIAASWRQQLKIDDQPKPRR